MNSLNWRETPTTDAMILKVMNGLRAFCTQSYDEANKKLGLQWEALRILTMTQSVKVYSVIRTGNVPVDLKSRVLGYDGLGVVGRIYKNPTFTGGTVDPLYNMNASLSNTSPETQLLSNVTVANVGVQIGASIYGIGPSSQQSRGSTPQGLGSNRILNEPNTDYLLEIESRDSQSQTVMARIELYEGLLDL